MSVFAEPLAQVREVVALGWVAPVGESQLLAALDLIEQRAGEMDDLLLRLRNSALRGRGGTPDYWISEIDDVLSAREAQT